MIFCSNCFKNPEIKSIITRINHKGSCPICHSQGAFIYDTDTDYQLSPLIENLLYVYTPIEDLPTNYPMNMVKPLAEAIEEDWKLFSDIPQHQVLEILRSVSPTVEHNIPQLFSQPVGIPERYNDVYLKEHSILHTSKWSDFVDDIKHRNRFHTKLLDSRLLQKYCLQIEENIEPGEQRYYRGRIADNAEGFTPANMGAPPIDRAKDGRANSEGISRLYLTDDRTTTFHEIRAAEYDFVTIGTFKLLQPIKLVDLSRIGDISPFGEEVDFTALAINLEHLQKINQEMSRPMRKGDSHLDYLPTQFISDLIMSITDENNKPVYDGIKYRSAMHSPGSNYTIFYPEKFKCTYSRTYEVTDLKFVYKNSRKAKKNNPNSSGLLG